MPLSPNSPNLMSIPTNSVSPRAPPTPLVQLPSHLQAVQINFYNVQVSPQELCGFWPQIPMAREPYNNYHPFNFGSSHQTIHNAQIYPTSQYQGQSYQPAPPTLPLPKLYQFPEIKKPAVEKPQNTIQSFSYGLKVTSIPTNASKETSIANFTQRASEEIQKNCVPVLLDKRDTQTITVDERGGKPEPFIPLKNLRNLYFTLAKFFNAQPISANDILKLRTFELDILDLIIRRKFERPLLTPETSRTDLEGLVAELTHFQLSLPPRRLEESYKLIFTRSIKHLKKVFRVNSCSHLSKEDFEHAFYLFYFKDEAQRSGLPLGNYIYPLNSRCQAGKLRSLNTNYFKQVASSRLFVKDLWGYVQKVLEFDYTDELEKKSLNVLLRWDEHLTGVDNIPEGQRKALFAEINRYFLKNKKCKLPWTMVELRNAVARVASLLEKMAI